MIEFYRDIFTPYVVKGYSIGMLERVPPAYPNKKHNRQKTQRIDIRIDSLFSEVWDDF
jgi:hypothetical protein